jgi:hypothetical protein
VTCSVTTPCTTVCLLRQTVATTLPSMHSSLSHPSNNSTYSSSPRSSTSSSSPCSSPNHHSTPAIDNSSHSNYRYDLRRPRQN